MELLRENQYDAHVKIENLKVDHKRELKNIRSQFKRKSEGDSEAKANFLKNLKVQIGCHDCKENDHRVLDFHHIEKKFFWLRNAGDYSWSEILEEIKKCEILCSNFHRKKTF